MSAAQQSAGKAVINHDEFNMVTGALQMSRINLEDIMTPLDKVYMLSTESILTMEQMASIVAAGFSRIPIYENDPHNVRGIMLVKNLIVVSPEDHRVVGSLGLRPPLVVAKTMGLHELLNAFQTGRSHIALVVDSPRKVTAALKSGRIIPPDVHMAGIVTLEDVLECIIQEEISDELDASNSVRQKLLRIYHKKRAMSLKINWVNERLIFLANQARMRVEQRTINNQSLLASNSKMKSNFEHPKLSSPRYQAQCENVRELSEASKQGSSSGHLTEPLLGGSTKGLEAELQLSSNNIPEHTSPISSKPSRVKSA